MKGQGICKIFFSSEGIGIASISQLYIFGKYIFLFEDDYLFEMIPPEVFLNEIAIIKDSNESEENMNLNFN